MTCVFEPRKTFLDMNVIAGIRCRCESGSTIEIDSPSMDATLSVAVIRDLPGTLFTFKIRMSDRSSIVKDITVAPPLTSLLRHFFEVSQNSALQVVDLFKAFLQHEC
jgi:hypothetical protein